MAYSAPPTWTQGMYPTAALMNIYKADLDAISAQVGSSRVQICVCKRITPIQSYYIVHAQRWLLYFGDGWIEDPAGVGERVTLGVEAAWTAHDLSSVEWLYPGKLYQVQNVDVCWEDYEDL